MAWPRPHPGEPPALTPTFPSNRCSSSEPTSALRLRARAALASVFLSNVTHHLLHVLAAPLPRRAAALLACHLNTHVVPFLNLSDDTLSGGLFG